MGDGGSSRTGAATPQPDPWAAASGSLDLTDLADAMASTANFLRQKGWQPGAGYQEGEPNHWVLREWNAATVYQQALAIMGPQIQG